MARFVLVVLALQIMNSSISCRIADDSFFSELDNSVNITDHALEFIVEDVLGFTNAFPEVKENKQQHAVPSLQTIQGFNWSSFKLQSAIRTYKLVTPIGYCGLVIHPYNKFFQKITPPPKTA